MQTQGMAQSSGQSDTQALERVENGHGAGLAQRENRAVRRAKGLGWFSVALGSLEIVAPHAVASSAGARIRPRTSTTMRLLGLRELASGLGILSERRTAAWLWAREIGR